MAENKRTFLEELQEAKSHSYAVGAFNIFNHLSARAAVRAAEELGLPVILQTSVVTVKEFGTVQLGAMLRQLAEDASVNVLIHLDHCQDVELAKACVDAGWDAVMYDGSRLSLEENIVGCRVCRWRRISSGAGRLWNMPTERACRSRENSDGSSGSKMP